MKLAHAVVAAALLLPFTPIEPDARASTYLALSLEDLAAAAQTVVIVVPTERRTTWEDGRIWSLWHARIEEHLAGAAPSSSDVVIRTAGGIVDRIGQWVEGEASFTSGQPSLVFLRPARGDAFAVVARAQGEFRVEHGALAHMPDLGKLVPRGVVASHGRVPVVVALDGATLTDARRSIAAAWRTTHAAP